MKIPRFGSLMDAVIWVAEQPTPCIGAPHCDEGGPCKRHDRTFGIAKRLWLAQSKGAKK